MPVSYLNRGGEILTATGIRNLDARTAWLANGELVVLWSNGNSSPRSIAFQLHDANGNKIGAPIVVDDVASNSLGPEIVALTGGNFVVTWRDGTAYTAKIYDPAGALVGAPVTIAISSSSLREEPTIALADGGFLAMWITGSTSISHAQRYSAAGVAVGSPFDINPSIFTSVHVGAAVELANGDFIVAWFEEDDRSIVHAARFTAAGVRVGAEFRVDSGVGSSLRNVSDMAKLENGGFVLVWTDNNRTPEAPDGNSVRARIYDAGGIAVSGDFVVHASSSFGRQANASVVALPSGGFLVTWTDEFATSSIPNGKNVEGQFFDDGGNRVGEVFVVSNLGFYTQTAGSISVSADGVIAIPFIDTSGLGASPPGSNTETDVRVQLMVPATTIIDTYNATTEFTASADQGGWTSIAALAGGGYAVSWEIFDAGGANASVQTRIFDASGAAIGGEVLISDSGNMPLQGNSDIAALAGGNYVVVWNDDGPGTASPNLANYDVRAQIMDAAGNKVGADFQVNGTTVDGQYAPVAAGLSNGGFAVAWTDRSATGGDTDQGAIRARIFDAAGTAIGGEFLVNGVTAGDQAFPDIVSLTGDRFLITWTSGSGAGASVKARLYGNDGTPAGSEFAVGAGDHCAAVGLDGGGFVIVSQAYNASGIADVWAQLFDAAGNAVGAAITVNTNAAGNQQQAHVSALDDGGFIVTWWTQLSSYSAGSGAIGAQIFDSAGVRVGGEFAVSTTIGTLGQPPAITRLDDGFAIAWSNGNAVETRLFSESTGQPTVHDDAFGGDESAAIAGNVFADNGFGFDTFPIGNNGRAISIDGAAFPGGQMLTLTSGAHLTMDRSGTFTYDPNGAFDYLAVGATGTETFTYGVLGGLAATVTITLNGAAPAPGAIEGTTGDDSISGTAAGEAISGLQGNDYLAGLGGNDNIRGNNGNDVIDGGSGADTMAGGSGDDIYGIDDNGDAIVELAGEGFDIAYASLNYALAPGRAIEILSVSDYSATTPLSLTGNEFGQSLYGNAGDNFLIAGAGADGLYGGLGNDTYSVDKFDVVIDIGGFDIIYSSNDFQLNAGSQIEIISANDFTLTTPLSLAGNELDQSIYGNAGNNFLIAGGGFDGLYGKGGNDSYSVDGNDVVIENAGEGTDTIYTSTSFILAAGNEIEILSANDYAATSPINLTGNALGQQLLGNAGANMLDGGAGADLLRGGGGADGFAFTTALGSTNIDRIEDFVSGTDKIVLDHNIFTLLGVGDFPEHIFSYHVSPPDSDDLFVYNSSGGLLYYIFHGALIQFATLTGHPDIVASDFVVI